MIEFLLINSYKDNDIIAELKEIKGVKEVYQTFGFEYDIIVKIEADYILSLRELERKIYKLSGIRSLLRLLCREF